MSQSASHYPISQLITRMMQERGFSRVEFVQSLGYRNIERGLRRLEPWLDLGEGYERIVKQIGTVYGHTDQIANAVAATKAVKSAEFEAGWIERCNAEAGIFRTYIHADGERTVPSGICIFGLTGGHLRWTTIEIPQNILDLPGEEQLAALPELMNVYRESYNGLVPFFGRLIGFKFVRLFDYFQFDQDGKFIGRVNRPFRCAPCSVRLT